MSEKICLNCVHAAFKENLNTALYGFAICNKSGTKARYFGRKNQCEFNAFQAADDAVIEKRINALNK